MKTGLSGRGSDPIRCTKRVRVPALGCGYRDSSGLRERLCRDHGVWFSRPSADLDVLEVAPREAVKPILAWVW
jgi:hypothetical protein